MSLDREVQLFCYSLSACHCDASRAAIRKRLALNLQACEENRCAYKIITCSSNLGAIGCFVFIGGDIIELFIIFRFCRHLK